MVAESGDDSEDEWNYVKVDKNGKEDTETHKLTENIVSPSPPTVSIGEPDDHDIESVEEAHAIAQAIAEPEETCLEVCIK